VLRSRLRCVSTPVGRTPAVTGFGYDFLYDTRTNGNAGLVSTAGRKKAAYFAFKNG
jgi:hypothetical protein